MILEILVFQAVCADSYLGQAELDSPGWGLGLLWQHPRSGNRTTGTYALTSLFPLITCAKEINKTNSSSFFQNKRENKQNKLQTQTTIKNKKTTTTFQNFISQIDALQFFDICFHGYRISWSVSRCSWPPLLTISRSLTNLTSGVTMKMSTALPPSWWCGMCLTWEMMSSNMSRSLVSGVFPGSWRKMGEI